MNNITMLTDSDPQKDYQNFIDALVEKCKIEDKENFEKEFKEFVYNNINKEHAQIDKLENKEEEIEKISKGFFTLISRYAGDFEFKEEMYKELSILKDIEVYGE